MKGGSPASQRVSQFYSSDCLNNQTNAIDLSAYNTSPKATLQGTYGVGYQTSGGRSRRKSRRSNG